MCKADFTGIVAARKPRPKNGSSISVHSRQSCSIVVLKPTPCLAIDVAWIFIHINQINYAQPNVMSQGTGRETKNPRLHMAHA